MTGRPDDCSVCEAKRDVAAAARKLSEAVARWRRDGDDLALVVAAGHIARRAFPSAIEVDREVDRWR